MSTYRIGTRFITHPAYTTILMWWIGARAEDAALAQVVALIEICKREQSTMFPDSGKRSAP
jgi:hypothetical protein